ncbi:MULTISPECIES: energy transducer TonB [unclassified Kaistella]|uniref:energy transducer TonB n=1 Tax=unclassified Kaistella TaxID=2762626 RepID=UPI00273732A9|nr:MULTISPECIES: energy transducer TonB [unclassified Kaistella]MDP2454887.1 energy transducer TonB [Kaistella sp. SH11-4b]MDP2456130.1 energy transducer TonB [Kaistella sp. SH40-3]MDP2460557.1 energy transducer TonB [Kaistella sp. SH19-2b]
MADENTYNSSPGLDEIVFENRNKAYGAYDLRTSYRSMLTKAFILGTVLFCVAAITPFVIMKIKQMQAKETTEVNANLIDILPEQEQIIEQPKDEPPPPPPPPKEEPKQEVIQNVVPEPVKAPKVETPPPPITKQLETTTGLANQEGVKTPSYTPPPPPPSTGTKVQTVEVKPQVSETQVYTEVEQLAEFPGGINAFRSKVSNSFDTSVMEGDEGKVQTTITFVVERDGSITDVKADGPNKGFNAEAVRTIKSVKNKWTPAKINGQAVRYRYRLPLTMQFE